MIKSIIFIGMAGVGKSSIGKAVASHYNFKFIDTDRLISADYSQPLSQIIDDIGSEEFNQLEANYVRKSVDDRAIISPGGSFIYSTETINEIKKEVVFLYLFDEPDNIKARISNLETRGIVGLDKKTFEELCFERHELYQGVANVQFQLNHYGFDQVTVQIINYLDKLNGFPF